MGPQLPCRTHVGLVATGGAAPDLKTLRVVLPADDDLPRVADLRRLFQLGAVLTVAGVQDDVSAKRLKVERRRRGERRGTDAWRYH